ncbi:class F sortase [Actinomycetospora termitidis]|uniref:Class F sortase n=1 Tax=Actinomycetospora termitidis TaxID=3053470 RepID=A0ABT7MAT2_9PSEU|nr:class F sortase [Actinomycetospora sp. Odt1-22]MDL5157137.1 class F sortase [Actinomycetospora sp. Odt1-22]
MAPSRRRVPAVAVAVLGAVLLLAACGAPGTTAGGPPPAVGTGTAAGPRDPTAPVSVRVSAIGVARDDVQRLGLAGDGTAEVPTDFDRVGWFAGGARATGGAGPTVLLGHVDSRRGPAVFYRLRDLRPGDVVEVGRADGSQARYAVTRSEQVAKDRFPTFAVFGATPDDVLRLVTCAGEFDRGARSYSDNLVVHTVRI